MNCPGAFSFSICIQYSDSEITHRTRECAELARGFDDWGLTGFLASTESRVRERAAKRKEREPSAIAKGDTAAP